MAQNLDQFLPLSNATLHILLALGAENRHGYGIMREVQRQSEGRYRIGPGTLYDNLQKLIEKEFVEEVPHKDEGDDPRRRYYKLTRLGRSVLTADIARLEGIVREASAFLRGSKPRRA
jgi:DNA-binding PadR family transcriptional regulator